MKKPPLGYPTNVPKDVCDMFEKLAFEARRAGVGHYSARTILERIRWHYGVDRGMREFKCNDHWSPYLARWFLKRHPDWHGFFELRVRNEQGRGRDWNAINL
jgi:hypothetical protein